LAGGYPIAIAVPNVTKVKVSKSELDICITLYTEYDLFLRRSSGSYVNE